MSSDSRQFQAAGHRYRCCKSKNVVMHIAKSFTRALQFKDAAALLDKTDLYYVPSRPIFSQ